MVTKSFSSKYLNNDQVTSEKYLYISNVKFTMKGCPENFVIFWCFSVHDMNHMWFEFRSSPTTPSWFFTEKSKKYTQYLTVLTNKNIWHKIWLILHHPKKFEHNWIKNGPAVRFYFWTLFANLNFLNFIACAIVQWLQQNSMGEEDLKDASLLLIAQMIPCLLLLLSRVWCCIQGWICASKIILAIRYSSCPLPPPSGHFGQTLSDKGDPLDLIFLALLLDMLFLGT